MAKVTGGEGLHWRGRIGNKVYYPLNGETICREIGVKPDKPPTEKELAAQEMTTLCANFNKPTKDFLRVGYSLQALAANKNYYGLFRKFFQTSISGTYPDRIIEYKDLLVTQGDMPVVENATVILNETGLFFSWNPDSQLRGMHYTDQVMMLAYFPDLNKARYMIAGAQRHHGQDILVLNGITRGHVAKIYISFIEDNHKRMSDSTYLGELIW